MTKRVVRWAYFRLVPAEGWLSLIATITAVFLMLAAVARVGWVRDDGIVYVTGLISLPVSLLLAKRGKSVQWSGILLFFYTLMGAFLYLSRPPVWALLTAGADGRLSWRRETLLMTARFLRWTAALIGGRSTRETIVFALFLGLSAGLLTGLLIWKTYRTHVPLGAGIFIAVLLAINAHFGGGSPWSVIGFAVTIVILNGTIQGHLLESSWLKRGVDYTEEIPVQLAIATIGIGIGIGGLSVMVIDLNQGLNRLSQMFQESQAVQNVDESLERAFGGVRPPQSPGATFSGTAGEGGAGGTGVFPRSFLVGEPPELAETPVLEARVSGSGQVALHWRANTYGVYTGRGWHTGEDIPIDVAAGSLMPALGVTAGEPVTQVVTWIGSGRVPAFYTLGRPLSLDQSALAYARFGADITRVIPPSNSPLVVGGLRNYTAVSQPLAAAPEMLRQAQTGDIPADILTFYTQLPENISQRVRDLAQEVTAGASNPYDQARALEAFLRQYEYDLGVEPIPEGSEPADYFLFELQRGYCDYYATAMVVMARAVGLPARLGVGYLAQTPDERGRQMIRRANAHSWAELYFAGHGWIEFEPTAPFPVEVENTERSSPLVPEEGSPRAAITPLPVPAQEAGAAWLWLIPAGVFALMIGYGIRQARLARRAGRDGIGWSYAQLRRNGAALHGSLDPSLTPREFGQSLTNLLKRAERQSKIGAKRLTIALRDVDGLIEGFERRQYGRPGDPRRKLAENQAAESRWFRLRGLLWKLRMRANWRRWTGQD